MPFEPDAQEDSFEADSFEPDEVVTPPLVKPKILNMKDYLKTVSESARPPADPLEEQRKKIGISRKDEQTFDTEPWHKASEKRQEKVGRYLANKTGSKALTTIGSGIYNLASTIPDTAMDVLADPLMAPLGLISKGKAGVKKAADELMKSPVMTNEEILAGAFEPGKGYSAKFRYFDPEVNQNMYDVVGGPERGYRGSTRSREGLEILGIEVPKAPPRALLPEVTQSVEPPKTSFITGETGTALNKPHLYDFGPDNPGMSRGTEQGTVLPRELEGLAEVTPEIAASGTVGRGARPGTLNEPLTATAIRDKINKNIIPEEPIDIPESEIIQELEKPIRTPETVDPIKTPKQAILDWTRGNSTAKIRGLHAAKDFDDVADPELIDKFQQGNRQGGLAKVQAFLDDLFNKEKEAGLYDDESYRDNYIRQYWDYDKSSPEAIKAYESRSIPKDGQFTKERTFETYQQGRVAGMVPKYTTIPEIIAARVEEGEKALRNKELYNYLNENGWIKKTKGGEPRTISSPGEWAIVGPHKKEIAKYLNNYLTKSRPISEFLGKMSTLAKNIYLSGGVPYTKYNMHAFNVARADAKIAGFTPAIKELVTDITGRKAANWFNNLSKSDEGLLESLVNNGYTHMPMEDVGVVSGEKYFSEMISNDKVREGLQKGLNTVQEMFEAPLFQRALPALKFKRAKDIFNKLVKGGMDEVSALRETSKITNEGYGGIEKSLRDKTGQDLSKFAIIAPDWAEAKIRQALGEWKGTAKTLFGKRSGADKIRAKAFGRGLTIPAAGYLANEALGKGQGESSGEFAGIPLGDKAYYPTMGTADESVRPFGIGKEVLEGNLLEPLKAELGNRLNPIPSSMLNLATNRNFFGGDIVNPNNSIGENITNIGAEGTRPLQHQAAVALKGYLDGSLSLEQAMAMGMELPVRFRRGDIYNP